MSDIAGVQFPPRVSRGAQEAVPSYAVRRAPLGHLLTLPPIAGLDRRLGCAGQIDFFGCLFLHPFGVVLQQRDVARKSY